MASDVVYTLVSFSYLFTFGGRMDLWGRNQDEKGKAFTPNPDEEDGVIPAKERKEAKGKTVPATRQRGRRLTISLWRSWK